jgi:HEPN domain-containing protein
MRQEIKHWWLQAQEDLDTAKYLAQGKKYYMSAFVCQQAVEKALKALYLLLHKKSSGPTHSLIHLASETKVPEKYFSYLRKLSPEFVITRYPDVSQEIPYKLYDKEKIEYYLVQTEDFFKWLKTQIKE